MTRSLKVPGSPSSALQTTVVFRGLFPAAELPLEPGGEARAAPAEQVRLLDLVDDALGLQGDGLPHGRSGRKGAEEDGPLLDDVVRDHRPDELGLVGAVTAGLDHLGDGGAGLHGGHEVPDRGLGQAGENDPVDDGGRLLVVHPDAGRVVKPDQPVGRGLAEPAAGRLFEGPGDRRPAAHPGRDGVVEVDGIGPGRGEGEEMVERDHPLDVRLGEAQGAGQLGQGFPGDVAPGGLDVPDHGQELGPVLAVPADDAFHAFHIRYLASLLKQNFISQNRAPVKFGAPSATLGLHSGPE